MRFKITRTSICNAKKSPCVEAVWDSECGWWYIDISNLDDLLFLESKYGDIIIRRNFWNSNVMEIEIYDEWRE